MTHYRIKVVVYGDRGVRFLVQKRILGFFWMTMNDSQGHPMEYILKRDAKAALTRHVREKAAAKKKKAQLAANRKPLPKPDYYHEKDLL